MAPADPSQHAKYLRAWQKHAQDCRQFAGDQLGPAICYHPLEYAWPIVEKGLSLYGPGPGKILWLGMNPGPWGMAQSGIPFGEVNAVRHWLQLDGPVGKPGNEIPAKPVQGLECPRSEVSGRRLWGLFQETFARPDVFAQQHFVHNYCPVLFLDPGGRNLTPDKLPKTQIKALFDACDEHLSWIINEMQPPKVIGIGGFASRCLQRVLGKGHPTPVITILHPSPASPMANKGWDQQVKKTLRENDIPGF